MLGGTVVALAAAAVVLAMFLADGFRATALDLSDYGVWVTKQGGPDATNTMVGRINARIATQDAALSFDAPGVDLAQDGPVVYIVDPKGIVSRVDPATLAVEKGGTGEVPAGSQVAVHGDRVLVVGTPEKADTGQTGRAAWITEPTPDGKVVVAGERPWSRLGSGGTALLDRTGRPVAFDTESGKLIVGTKPDRTATAIGFGTGSEQLQLTAVGDRAVVVDRAAGKYLVEGGEPLPLPDAVRGDERSQVQLPGDDADGVLVATSESLLRLPLDGGTPTTLESWDGSGQVPAPAHVAGCDYGAALGAASARMVVRCGDAREVRDLGGKADDGWAPTPDESFRFRINRKNVALNAIRSGAAFAFVDGAIRKVDSWNTGATVTTPTSNPENPDKPRVLDLTAENHPPKPQDDRFGARGGVPTPLPVLDNDTDEDGDLLTVSVADDAIPDCVGCVTVIANSQKLQVTVPRPGGYTFTYQVSDGRTAEPVPASVSLNVLNDKTQTPPHRREGAIPPFRLEAGTSGTYDALSNYVDDEGDPIVIASATTPAPDRVVNDPSGLLTFTDGGTAAATKSIQLVVRDIPPSPIVTAETSDDLNVEVFAANDAQPPTANADYASTQVGQPVVIRALANDSDPNGDRLQIVGLDLDSLAVGDDGQRPDVTFDPDGNIRFLTTGMPGNYVFGYLISDSSTNPVTGVVRVDVLPTGNRAPAAGRDLVVLPVAPTSSRTVDLLANDVDPDGDVLVVRSITPPAGSMQVQLIDRRRLRVSVSGELTVPVVLRYEVSDGRSSATGEVTVVSQRVETGLVPLPQPDAVAVRVGDLVSIPVLANDIDPLGGDLYLRPQLVLPPPADRGQAWVSGRSVRFLAPDKPGRVEMTYGVSRSVDASVEDGSATITVNVLPDSDRNDPPTPRTVEARVLAGGSVRIPIPLSGIDANGDTVALVGLDLGGDVPTAPQLGRVVTPVGADSITYEAFSDPRTGSQGGTDIFHYLVRDQRGATASGVVRVGVAPRSAQNQKPVAIDDPITLRPGSTTRIAVLANDYDPDDDAIALVADGIQSPKGVTATVEGTSIRVTVPDGDGPLNAITYWVEDAGGARAYAAVKITLDENAPGIAPIARDDRVVSIPRGQTEVAVDVLGNDEDPDGSIDDLVVDTLGSPTGVEVRGKEIVVRPSKRPRMVPYVITDRDELRATAVVWVPASDDTDQAPVPIVPPPEWTVKEGETLTIPLKKVVRDPEGADVRITFENRVVAVNNDGSSLLEPGDATRLVFRPKADYSGPGSVTFEVTDGKDGNSGKTAVITVAITIRASTNQAPAWLAEPTAEVAFHEDPAVVTLAGLVEDPEKDDLTFALGDLAALPGGLKVDLDEAAGELSASLDAVVDEGDYRVPLTVTDGQKDHQPVETQAVVRVIASIQPLPVCRDEVLGNADAGEPVVRDVTELCSNPFPDIPLVLSAVTGDNVERNGNVVTFTPPKGEVGDVTIGYEVIDGARRTAKGVITATIRDVPGKPSQPVATVASRSATLQWNPPAFTGGAPIDYYTVAWTGGRPDDRRCPSTTCVIDGLENDVTYTFTVTAHNDVGDGEVSDASLPARPDQRPEAPAAVTLSFVEPSTPDTVGGTLTASWTASVTEGSAVTGYRIQIIPPPPTGDALVTTDGPETTKVLTGLANGTSYRVQVSAVNKAATGPSDTTESNPETPARTTSPAQNVKATRVKTQLGGVATVTWSAPKDNGGDAPREYTIVSFRAGTTTEDHERVTVPGTQTTVQLDGFDKTGDFQFAVISTNKAGDADPSALSNVVQPGGIPDAITTLAAEDSDGNTGLDQKVRLTFVAPNSQAKGGIAQYKVTVDGSERPDRFTSTTIVVGSLQNGREYSFTVVGCNALGDCGPTSNSVKATPYGPVRQPNISTGRPSSRSVSFSWSKNADNGRRTSIEVSDNNSNWGGAPDSGSVARGDDWGQSFCFYVRAKDSEGQISPVASACNSTDGLVADNRSVDDFFLKGTWVRNSTVGGAWGNANSTPADAHQWLPNGTNVQVKCAASGGQYAVRNNGVDQTWSWWMQRTDGKWVRSAVLYANDGDAGIRHC